MDMLKKFLPNSKEIPGALGLVFFIVFTWSIRGFLYKVPSFSLYYAIGETLGVFFYMMSFALLESLLISGLIIFLSVLLPRKLLREGLLYKSFILMLFLTAAAIYLQNIISFKLPPMKDLVVSIGSIAAVLIAVSFIVLWFERVRSFVSSLMDRMSIFFYFYLALGCISVVAVLIRNIL